MLAARAGNTPVVQLLLRHGASVAATDNDGNTALHYASAYGQLLVIRTLLYAGASPVARNAYSWTPISYSSTVAAEVYFKNLVAEFERRRVEESQRDRERGKRVVGPGGGGGVRLVTEKDGGVAVRPGEDDEGEDGGAAASGSMSPLTMRRRAQTPTAGRSDGWGLGFAAGLRARASSGD